MCSSDLKVTKQGRLTDWRPQREGLVRTQKESDQARQTHKLESAEGRASQHKERMQESSKMSVIEIIIDNR